MAWFSWHWAPEKLMGCCWAPPKELPTKLLPQLSVVCLAVAVGKAPFSSHSQGCKSKVVRSAKCLEKEEWPLHLQKDTSTLMVWDLQMENTMWAQQVESWDLCWRSMSSSMEMKLSSPFHQAWSLPERRAGWWGWEQHSSFSLYSCSTDRQRDQRHVFR